MSKAIIRPRMMPRRIALPPDIELSPSVSWSISQEIGLPSTIIIARPASTDANSGMTRTGIRPRAQVGTFQLGDPVRGDAREDATDHRADEPGGRVGDAVGALHVEEVGGQPAHDEARRDAGAVGDRVGDVARQGREEQREGGLADDEEERAEVGHQPGVEQGVVEPERLGVGQVEEAVVDGDVAVGTDDLVAAQQEAQRDQQTAGGDERDHVRDTGHQHPAGAATPRLRSAVVGTSPRRPRPRRAGRSRDRRRSAAPRRSSRRRRRSAASRWS